MTGEVFTIPKTDLLLAGFFNLKIDRQYSTQRRTFDVGLGWGWTHSFAWEMHFHGRTVVIRNGFGQVQEFPVADEPGYESQAGNGWTLLRTPYGYLLRPGGEFHHYFTPDKGDPSTYHLTAIAYRNAGVVTLDYQKGRLVRAVDSAGRDIYFGRGQDGRITSISVPGPGGANIVYARYEYDHGGHLVAATDADGASWKYRYDDDRRLIDMQMPTGLSFHYRYDRKGRCVETWGDHHGGVPDPTLDDSLSPLLADGRTKARGLHHTKLDFGEGYTEVISSARVQRFFGLPDGKVTKAVNGVGAVTTRTLDASGNEIERADPNGAVFQWSYDRQGNVVRETDPMGGETLAARDEEGRLIRMIDPAGVDTSFDRDLYGNLETVRFQNGGVATFQYTSRGRPSESVDPSGCRWTFEWDARGNCIRQTGANGAVYQFEYDYWGRQIAEIMPNNGVHKTVWSDGGRVLREEDALGRTKHYEYDGFGNVVSITLPDGQTIRYLRGGMGWIHGVVYPNGDRLEYRFNREGWLLSERNEKGELTRYVRDGVGRGLEEHSSNGRIRKFSYDLVGNILKIDDGSAGITEIERNLAGQVLKRISPDGTELALEYDVRGMVMAAASPSVKAEFEYDAMGEVVRERQTVGGQTYVVDIGRDPGGLRTGISTSLGLDLRVVRDRVGKVSELRDPSGSVVRFSRDPAGSTIRRDFARGGAVVDAFDPVGRLTSRQVVKPGAGPTAGEPEWLGAAPPGTVYKSYGYSPINEITEITTAADGTTELEYDVRRRLVRKRPRRGPEELWSTNGLGDYFERGPGSPTRSYLSGGRIAAKAATDYTWDDRGFLIEKRKGLPEGGSERWRYTWNGSDLLSNVELPDGRTVELEYDAWARRALKRLRAAQRLGGGGEVLSTTHYVWDRHMLVHEVQLSGNDTGGSRTYLFENEDLTPLAQREGSGEWIHYVGDVCETPDELVDSAGNLVGRLTRSTFGAANAAAGSQATTPFRAPGQFADDEIGLHYNRYRYYDPETGHYISPDPIGTSGGTNLYGYGPNPIGWFDPLGWQGHQAIAAATAPPPPPGGSPIPLPPPDGNGVYNAGPRPGPNGAPTYPNGQDPRNHTERQILSDLQSTGQAQGAKVNISGQLPPCPQCHRAMQAFAKANGATINYTYNGNTVTYGPGGATSGSPGDAATLVGAYAMKSTPGAQNTATEGTPGANGYPYGYQNYSNAWNTYASQKNPIQQAGQTGPNAPPPTPAQPKFP